MARGFAEDYNDDMRWLWYRRVHPMWHVALWCAGCVVGIASSGLVDGLVNIGWAVLGLGLALLCLRLPRAAMLVLMLISGVLFGLWRGGIEQQQTLFFQHAISQQVVVSGRVADDPKPTNKGQAAIKIYALSSEEKQLTGEIYITTQSDQTIKRSDVIKVRGKLSPGFGSYNATMYDAIILEHSRVAGGDVGLTVRDAFTGRLRVVVEEPMSSLGLGFLVGQSGNLSPQLETALRTAGLTHIVVASGYNLTILVRLARRFLAKHSRYLATIVPLGLIGGFLLVTGMSPSMSRAGIVAGLGILAWYYGRKFHPVVLLAIAAAISTIIHPSYAWGDVGWLLSFAAFAGVLLLAPIMQHYFFGSDRPGMFRQVIGETIAAQVATLPIIIAVFGSISLVALPANLMIVPLIPIAMLSVFLAGIFQFILPPVAGLIGWVAQQLLSYMVHIAQWWAGLPIAQMQLPKSMLLGVVIALFIMIVAFCMARAGKVNLREQSIVE